MLNSDCSPAENSGSFTTSNITIFSVLHAAEGASFEAETTHVFEVTDGQWQEIAMELPVGTRRVEIRPIRQTGLVEFRRLELDGVSAIGQAKWHPEILAPEGCFFDASSEVLRLACSSHDPRFVLPDVAPGSNSPVAVATELRVTLDSAVCFEAMCEVLHRQISTLEQARSNACEREREVRLHIEKLRCANREEMESVRAAASACEQNLRNKIQKIQRDLESAVAWQRRSWPTRAFHRWRPLNARGEKASLVDRLEHSLKKRLEFLFPRAVGGVSDADGAGSRHAHEVVALGPVPVSQQASSGNESTATPSVPEPIPAPSAAGEPSVIEIVERRQPAPDTFARLMQSPPRLLHWGAPASIPCAKLTPAGQFEASFQNFGNLLIGRAVLDTVHSAAESRSIDFELDSPEDLSRNFDAVAISASNFFNEYQEGFTREGTFFEKLDLPFCVFGLGSQGWDHKHGSDGFQQIQVRPGMRRFLEILADRSVSLGVRGEYTARQLAGIGIKNSAPVGCPSYFSQPESVLGIARLQPVESDEFRFLFNSDPTILENPGGLDSMRRFHWDCISAGGTFVAQNEWFVFGTEGGDAREKQRILATQAYFDFQGLRDAEVFRKHRCRWFADVDCWSTFAGRHHFSIGPRFHGNMIAIRAGRPAMIVVHDHRIRELVETLRLTSISSAALDQGIDPYEAYCECLDRFSIKNYRDCFTRFVDFLKENRMEPKVSLPHA